MQFNTPRTLALAIAAAITFLLSLATLFCFYYFDLFDQLPFFFLHAGLAFVISFALIYFAVQRFLYKHIKLLYRTIQSKKTATARVPDVSMGEDVLGDVESKVTEWAESKKEEIEQLQQQETFRREFLGNLAHELKTPVFNVQGYILTLLEGGLEDPSINRDYLNRASKGIDRMTYILDELDTITRFESQRMELTIERFDLVKLVKEVMEALENQAEKSNVSLVFKEEYGEIYVEADRPKIERVFVNLIGNAINYSKEGGKVEVRFYETPESQLVEIADNGVGINEEHLPRLFERFYRVEKSRSRHIGGTGLGLAIVKHILDAHNQTINVRSAENVGSTFSFTLAKG